MAVNILSTVELTGLEKAFLTHGGWTTIGHVAHLTGDQSVIIENISSVIPHLLKRHPRMRSRVLIDGYQQFLQILDYNDEYFNPNLFYSIIDKPVHSWQKIVDEECHRNPFSDHEKTIFPLFRFVLILNQHSQSVDDLSFHLLLLSNHAASDGRSGYIVLNDFLTLVTSADLRERKEPANTEIIPCLAELIPRPYGFSYPLISVIAKHIYKNNLRKLHQPRIPVKTTVLSGESTPFALQPIKFHMLFTSSSTSLYSRLHEKCRSQQLSLHGPLYACLRLAVHHCFPLEDKSDRYLLPWTIDLDFDMRSRLPGSPLKPSTVGFCVGICQTEFKQKHSLISTPFWDLARECVLITNQTIESRVGRFMQHLMKDTLESERKLNKFFDSAVDGRVSELNFSNIGKYPFSCDYNHGQMRLRGLHVTNGASIYHTSNVLLVTCVGDGQLDFSLAHEMASEDKAREFLDYFVQLIETCADADPRITLKELLTALPNANTSM